MTHVATLAIVLTLAPLARAGTSVALTDHESPRATDLLRAKQLAERTQSRLRVPHVPSRGWVHGGEGWQTPAKPPERDPRVIVNVGPTRQRKASRSTAVD